MMAAQQKSLARQQDKMGSGTSQPTVQNKASSGTSQFQNVRRKFGELDNNDLDINDIRDLLQWLDDAEKKIPSSGASGKASGVKWNQLVNEVTEIAEEKNVLLNSLSEIAGARLKNNNPNITDLSDKNRSSKVAERFSELYDNQWTDAIEDVRDEMVSSKEPNKPQAEEDIERVCIDFLLNVLIAIYKWCEKTSQDQLFRLVKTFIPKATKDKEKWDQDITKRCKDFWKVNMSTEESLELIQSQIDKEVMGTFRPEYPNTCAGSHFKRYWQLCAELCWYMNIQDPPVAMIYEYQENQGTENQGKSKERAKELFRAYTCSGYPLKYIVWPTLLLHKNGPMLYKGVAQFEPKESSL